MLADYEMAHWPVSLVEMPGWRTHFQVWLLRNLKKTVRKRKGLYAKFTSVFASSVICGLVVSYTGSDRNLIPMCATSSPL